jgi:hypothetical protein
MKESPKEAIPKAFELVETLLAMHRAEPGSVDFGEIPGKAVAIGHVPVEGGGAVSVMVELTATPLLNQTQAAAAVKVSTRTLQKWAGEGLPSVPYKVGNRVFPMYPERFLREYAEKIGHRPGWLRVGQFGRRKKEDA